MRRSLSERILEWGPGVKNIRATGRMSPGRPNDPMRIRGLESSLELRQVKMTRRGSSDKVRLAEILASFFSKNASNGATSE